MFKNGHKCVIQRLQSPGMMTRDMVDFIRSLEKLYSGGLTSHATCNLSQNEEYFKALMEKKKIIAHIKF